MNAFRSIYRPATLFHEAQVYCVATTTMVCIASMMMLAPVSVHAQNSSPSKEQIELQNKQLDLEKAKVELERSKNELESARLALQAKETEQQLSMQLQGDVVFDFGEATLRPEAKESLNKVAVVLSQFPDSNVEIRGYTDAKGSAAANLKLSEQRAMAVKSWLVKQAHIDEADITAKGLGEAEPVADNKKLDGSDNPEGRQKNRRVEIVVMKVPQVSADAPVELKATPVDIPVIVN